MSSVEAEQEMFNAPKDIGPLRVLPRGAVVPFVRTATVEVPSFIVTVPTSALLTHTPPSVPGPTLTGSEVAAVT